MKETRYSNQQLSNIHKYIYRTSLDTRLWCYLVSNISLSSETETFTVVFGPWVWDGLKCLCWTGNKIFMNTICLASEYRVYLTCFSQTLARCQTIFASGLALGPPQGYSRPFFHNDRQHSLWFSYKFQASNVSIFLTKTETNWQAIHVFGGSIS